MLPRSKRPRMGDMREFQAACSRGDEERAKIILNKFKSKDILDLISPQGNRTIGGRHSLNRQSYFGLRVALNDKRSDLAKVVLDTASSKLAGSGPLKSLLPYATSLGHDDLVERILEGFSREEISKLLKERDVQGNLTCKALKWGFRERKEKALTLILEKVIHLRNPECDYELQKIAFPYACGIGNVELVKKILAGVPNAELPNLVNEEKHLGLTHAFNVGQSDTITMTLTSILEKRADLDSLSSIFPHAARLGNVDLIKTILEKSESKDFLTLLIATDYNNKSGIDWVKENRNGAILDVMCAHLYKIIAENTLKEEGIVQLFQKLIPAVVSLGASKQVERMLKSMNSTSCDTDNTDGFISANLTPDALLFPKDMGSFPLLHVICREANVEIQEAKETVQCIITHIKEAGHGLFEKAFLHKDSRERIPLHWACIAGNLEVVRILVDSTKSLEKGNSILEKALETKDDNQCTALSWACIIGHAGIVDLFLKCLTDEKGDINKDKIQEVLLNQTMDGKTCLHWACENNFQSVVEIILASIEGDDEMLLQQFDRQISEKGSKATNSKAPNSKIADANWNPLHYAFYEGNMETVNLLRTKLSDTEVFQNALKSQDGMSKMTPLHWACANNHTHILGDLISKNQENNNNTQTPIDFMSLLKIKDRFGKTVIHIASSNGNDELMEILIDYVRNNKNKEHQSENPFLVKDNHGLTPLHSIIYAAHIQMTTEQRQTIKLMVEFLHETDNLATALKIQNDRKETALHLACRFDQAETVILLIENLTGEEMKAVLCITDDGGNYPFGLADKTLINKVIENQKERNVPICLTIMAQMNKFGNSYFDDDENTDRIIEILDDYKKKKLANVNNSLSVTYPDFYGHKQQNIPYAKAIANHPLTIIGNTGNLSIIKHPYIYFYVHTLWKSFVRYICWANIFLYFVFLIFMCSFVTTHNFYDLQSGEDESITTGNASMHSSQQARTTELDYEVTSKVYSEISRVGMVALALAGLFFKGFQLKTKRSQYWAYKENFTDLFIFVAASVLAILPLTIGYNPWIHSFGSFLIICATINTTWMLTKVPKYGNYFLMLLSVLTKVLMFTPVLALFIVTYAIVFHNLLRNQSSFENLGLSILRVMAMSIGELEYRELFFDESNYTVFEIVSMIVFVLFLFVMTISMMALLIGVAVGDINELNKQGKQKSFQSQVDLILQYAYMFPSLNKIRHEKEIYRLQYMRQKYRSQLDDQHRSFLDNLEKHYKRFQTLARADGIVTEHEVRQIMKDELHVALKDIKKERNKEQGDQSSLQLQIKALSEMLEKQFQAMKIEKPYKEQSDC